MLILTAIFCGLRKSELMALTWEDINLDKGFINVDKATSVVKDRNTNSDKNYKTIVKDPKSISSIRTVPIPKDLISKLHDYEKTMRLKNFKTHGKELLFPSMYNNFLDHNTVSKRLKSATEEADIPYLNFHKLRHTYITRLIENNMNIKVVQNLVGHSNSAITLDVYSHVTENASKVAKEEISSIFQLKEDEDKYADLTDTSISFLLSHTNNSVNLSITPNNYN